MAAAYLDDFPNFGRLLKADVKLDQVPRTFLRFEIREFASK